MTQSLASSLSKDWSLGAGGNVALMRGKSSMFADMSMSLNESTNRTKNTTTESLNDNVTQTYRTDRSKLHELTLRPSINYGRSISPKTILRVSISADYADNTNDGWSVDTLTTSSAFRVLLNNSADGKKIEATGQAELRTKISEHSSASLSYIFGRNYNKSKQISLDYLSDPQGTLDQVNSYNYTINSVSNSLFGEWSYNKNDFRCSFNLRGILYDVKLEEKLPNEGRYPHTFFLLNPGVNLSWGKPQSRLMLSMGSYSNIMSVEQLRNSLDISNPMYIVAGNPNLRPSNNASFNLSYSTTNAAKARMLDFGISGGYVFNNIVSKRTLYMQSQYLPEYDYTVAEGAQIATNLNVDGNLRLGASVGYSQRIAVLQSTLHASLMYNYLQNQYFVGESLQDSYNHEASVALSMSTGFSTKVRIYLSSITSLGNYKTFDAVSRYIRESVHGNLELRPIKRYFLLMSAAYQVYHNASLADATQSNVVANGSLGRKFGEGDKFSLSAGVVDIFNRTSSISTVLNHDYLRTQTASYLGRYGYLAIAYTF